MMAMAIITSIRVKPRGLGPEPDCIVITPYAKKPHD
jgi:hypothetical protein